MSKSIYLIVCVDKKNGIAKNNTIPWKLKSDMEFFKETTTCTSNNTKKNAVIMGRKTAYTLKGPLSDRLNIVLTRNPEHKSELETKGFMCYDSIEESIKYCDTFLDIESIYLIGGLEVYNYGLSNPNKIENIYMSYINQNYNCDQFFNIDLLQKYFYIEKLDIKDGFILHIWKRRNNPEEKEYLELLDDVYKTGHKRQTRNGVTYSKFGKTLEFNLKNSFPLLTTKKMFLRGIFEELKFFLLGQTDNKILKDKGIHIWDGNTTKEFIDKCNLPYDEDTLGPMYGFQWRHFNAHYIDSKTDYTNQGVDQLKQVIELIKTDPFSRRILMTTYNPEQAGQGVLYPCHGISIQFYVEEDKSKNLYLNCMMHQRSMDSFLGAPFNIASYALLVYILCNHINNTGKVLEKDDINPGRLIMVFGDVHIYQEHIEAIETQINREPYIFPRLNINYNILSFDKTGCNSIGELEFSHLKIIDYKSYDAIKAKMIA